MRALCFVVGFICRVVGAWWYLLQEFELNRHFKIMVEFRSKSIKRVQFVEKESY